MNTMEALRLFRFTPSISLQNARMFLRTSECIPSSPAHFPVVSFVLTFWYSSSVKVSVLMFKSEEIVGISSSLSPSGMIGSAPRSFLKWLNQLLIWWSWIFPLIIPFFVVFLPLILLINLQLSACCDLTSASSTFAIRLSSQDLLQIFGYNSFSSVLSHSTVSVGCLIMSLLHILQMLCSPALLLWRLLCLSQCLSSLLTCISSF